MWLCQDFTTEEVFCVLQSLRKNSSPGVDGIPAEWYRFASHEANSPFVQAMTNLFNLIWKTSYPSQGAALVPVPKSKGSVYDKDNHRGIAVSNSIGKVFSLCMIHRLDAWAEGSTSEPLANMDFEMVGVLQRRHSFLTTW
jgi:hypothetical protein